MVMVKKMFILLHYNDDHVENNDVSPSCSLVTDRSSRSDNSISGAAPARPYLLPGGETDLFNPSSWLFPGDYTEADDVEADYTEPDDDTDAADADADAGEADDVEADEDGGEADYTEADDADADNNNVD